MIAQNLLTVGRVQHLSNLVVLVHISIQNIQFVIGQTKQIVYPLPLATIKSLPKYQFLPNQVSTSYAKKVFYYSKVSCSRPVYYSIFDNFVQRSQYVSIKILLHKQSENPWICYILTDTVYCSRLQGSLNLVSIFRLPDL